MKITLIFLIVLSFAFSAFAQESIVPGESVIDAVIKALGAPALAVSLGLAIDFAMRFKVSGKAIGLIHSVAGVLKIASRLLLKVSELAGGLANLSDKVLPQNVDPKKSPDWHNV